MHTKFWSENLKERHHSKSVGIDARIILDWTLGKEVGEVWMECIWLRTRISGGLLWIWL
jgi:hypothetical protein